VLLRSYRSLLQSRIMREISFASSAQKKIKTSHEQILSNAIFFITAANFNDAGELITNADGHCENTPAVFISARESSFANDFEQ
jgi:hypothetical protein